MTARKEFGHPCLRCGIGMSEQGRVCKDCHGVDPEYSAALRAEALRRQAIRRRMDILLEYSISKARRPV